MKKKNSIERINEVVQNDRLSVNDEFCKIVNSDLERVLREYFDFNNSTGIQLVKVDDKYKISFSIEALRIKSFAKIP